MHTVEANELAHAQPLLIGSVGVWEWPNFWPLTLHIIQREKGRPRSHPDDTVTEAMMRLGAMLVRDGRLTAAQVLAAVGQQARVGGRLGTVLMEMRLIDADTLTVYLGLELGVPVATRMALARAKRAALRLLPAALAERFFCVPLAVQERQLIVAMRDPHDLLALDELASGTGYRIIPRVAPEARIVYYLEQHFGVARSPRFLALGDSVIAPPQFEDDAVEPPPPPLPGLPPALRHPIVPPTPVPRLVELSAVRAAAEITRDLVEGLDDPGHSVDIEAMARAAVSPLPGTSTFPVPLAMPDVLGLDAAIVRMSVASRRSEIADALLAYARGIFDTAVLLIVRDELAFGWKGFGAGVDPERVETLLVPLETSSMFRAALDAGDPFVTAPPASVLHLHLLKVLRAPMPHRAVVAPVIIKERAVNLLYGQVEGERRLGSGEVVGIGRAAAAASNGYVRLIALHKQGG